jgi:predicted peroxiredoxin
MLVDILMFVDMKGAPMFRKKKVTAICDNGCMAARLREDTLFKAALHGPRI